MFGLHGPYREKIKVLTFSKMVETLLQDNDQLVGGHMTGDSETES